jgi:hypothetical protein
MHLPIQQRRETDERDGREERREKCDAAPSSRVVGRGRGEVGIVVVLLVVLLVGGGSVCGESDRR